MSYQTPDGWAQRAMMRDDKAPHQIRIESGPRMGAHALRLFVTCTCKDFSADILTAEEAAQLHAEHRRLVERGRQG